MRKTKCMGWLNETMIINSRRVSPMLQMNKEFFLGSS
jgi:hypothetical protein